MDFLIKNRYILLLTYTLLNRECKLKTVNKTHLSKKEWVLYDLFINKSNCYQKNLLKTRQIINYLVIIDKCWLEYISYTKYIKETLTWKTFEHSNILNEYNLENYDAYKILLNNIFLMISQSFYFALLK